MPRNPQIHTTEPFSHPAPSQRGHYIPWSAAMALPAGAAAGPANNLQTSSDNCNSTNRLTYDHASGMHRGMETTTARLENAPGIMQLAHVQPRLAHVSASSPSPSYTNMPLGAHDHRWESYTSSFEHAMASDATFSAGPMVSPRLSAAACASAGHGGHMQQPANVYRLPFSHAPNSHSFHDCPPFSALEHRSGIASQYGHHSTRVTSSALPKHPALFAQLQTLDGPDVSGYSTMAAGALLSAQCQTEQLTGFADAANDADRWTSHSTSHGERINHISGRSATTNAVQTRVYDQILHHGPHRAPNGTTAAFGPTLSSTENWAAQRQAPGASCPFGFPSPRSHDGDPPLTVTADYLKKINFNKKMIIKNTEGGALSNGLQVYWEHDGEFYCAVPHCEGSNRRAGDLCSRHIPEVHLGKKRVTKVMYGDS